MELAFKSDFKGADNDWSAFWDGVLGRPAVIAVHPKPGIEPVAPPDPYLFGHAADLDALARRVPPNAVNRHVCLICW